MFSADGHLHIVTEDDLTCRRIFRRHHVDGLVGVVGKNTGSGQFLRQVGSDDLSAVQTYDGINRGGNRVMRRQKSGYTVSLAAAGFHGGNINVAVDVRVRCGKMTVKKLKCHIRIDP